MIAGSGVPPWSLAYQGMPPEGRGELVFWRAGAVRKRERQDAAIVDLAVDAERRALFAVDAAGWLRRWDLDGDDPRPVFSRELVKGPLEHVKMAPGGDWIAASTGMPAAICVGDVPSYLFVVSARTGEPRLVAIASICGPGFIRTRASRVRYYPPSCLITHALFYCL